MKGVGANRRRLAWFGGLVTAALVVFWSELPISSALAAPRCPALPVPAWVPEDPLQSAYPMPWCWVWGMQTQAQRTRRSLWGTTQSPVLVSPDGRYSVFSRVQILAHRNYTRTQVTSTLHIRRPGGALPIVLRPLGQPRAVQPGQIWVLVPVSWSADGSQLLVRQVAGWFGSSEISDSALVWQNDGAEVRAVMPQAVTHTHSLLLGWSRETPTSILFETRLLGLERASLWQVGLDGLTLAAREDAPVTYGQSQGEAWTMLEYRLWRR
ncbi:hypothetical protein GlitD10_2153 [Gloeomargarita lithophora Alchichica-D10]|uniref:Uncharacterized protein n=1 Tax=Gloeomargarita lithophora Alchichica-D10 TaxID=1188229 RepID=A0A1J0AEW2_9CYAN|nr:hypothetical protein [Gloeomargarita lithophora]APB34482.1 hypothetical protein GlitD10_2153 [Gloeomargarita lithophora Alchichica-D10]